MPGSAINVFGFISIGSLFHQLLSSFMGSLLTNTVLHVWSVLSFTNIYFLLFIFFSFNLLVSVTSPMVPGSIRNIHEGKVSGQMGNAANHHSDRHGTEDYLNIVHRLSTEVQLHKTKNLRKKWFHCSCMMSIYQLLLNNCICLLAFVISEFVNCVHKRKVKHCF